jgi:hypothetical protein
MQPKRIGFYPACDRDYLEPLRLLKGRVDELIFCDICSMPKLRDLKSLRQIVLAEELPNPSILVGDALVAMEFLKPVDLLYLRRDSNAEGGSGLVLLSPRRLPLVFSLIKPGGTLVTDRSNGRDWFAQFQNGRRSPYRASGHEMQLAEEQPWVEQGLLAFIAK